jgi:hypothetical protein
VLWDDLLAADEVERDPAVGPSDAGVLVPGKRCARQLAYRVQRVEPTDPVPDALARATVLGTLIHEGVARARHRFHPTWLIEVEVDVPGFDRPGRADAVAFDPGPDGEAEATVDDLKTLSDRVYQRVAEVGVAREQDQRQVELYGLGASAAGLNVARLSVTYLNRSNGDSWADVWSYDPAAAERTALAMHAVIDRTAGTPPEEIERGGRHPDWSPCHDCRWRARCWGTPPGQPAPTLVSERAAPAEVEAAARQMRGLRAERARVQDAIDYCREVLVSHDGAAYEDADGTRRQIRWTAGRPPGEGGALDQAAARALLEYYGETPPTIGTAPRLSFPAVR